MDNGRVPDYYKVDPPVEQNPAYLEWWARIQKELSVTEEAFVEEYNEYKNYEQHGILPTVYLDVVKGFATLPPEFYQRRDRAVNSSNFTNGYKFVEGVKGFITPENSHSFWSDKCFDSTWVAVHGIKALCVVTRRQIVDMTRLAPFYHEFSTTQIMCGFAETIISLVECLPYDDTAHNDDDLRLCFGHMIEKPFSVVSVVPDTKKVHDASGHEDINYEYDVNKAALFLEEKMKSGLAFTIDETIQAAIIAFQHMCHWELKAEDIWVTYMEFPHNGSNHLCLDEIKDHFAVIKGSSSAVAPPKSIFFGYHPSLKCDYESDNQPSQDFLVSQLSSLSIR